MEDILEYRDILEKVQRGFTDRYINTELYKQEFDELKAHSDGLLLTESREDGWIQHNRSKNRYKDIIPYDRTRVRLPMLNNLPGSDYINASHISGPKGYVNYIAAQGPVPGTVFDFWRMVWYNYVTVIVMVCRQFELGKEKCANYWGKGVGDTLDRGNFQVKLVSEQTDGAVVIRKLVLNCAEVSREVYQYQYLEWPDRDVPTDCDPLYKMLALVRQTCPEKKRSDGPGSPIVIHCSAGCGRTGTVLAIDFIDTLIRQHKLTTDFSLFELVKMMRTERVAICQTKKQYGFVYYTAIQLLESALETLSLRVAAVSESIYENVPLSPTTKEPEEKTDPLFAFEPAKPDRQTKPATDILVDLSDGTPATDAIQTADYIQEPLYTTVNVFNRTCKVDLEEAPSSSDEPPPLPAPPAYGRPVTVHGEAPLVAHPLVTGPPPVVTGPPPLVTGPPPDWHHHPAALSRPCEPATRAPDQIMSKAPSRDISPVRPRDLVKSPQLGYVRSPVEQPPHKPVVTKLSHPPSVPLSDAPNRQEKQLDTAQTRGGEADTSPEDPYAHIVRTGPDPLNRLSRFDDDNDSEISAALSDATDSISHALTTSGDEGIEEDGDIYETFETTDKGHRTSKEKENLHKKFSLGGKKLNSKKGKGFGFKNMIANMSEGAATATKELKSRSHLPTNLTSNITSNIRNMTNQGNAGVSTFPDLPELNYVSEFGKRTGKPMGPRDMPDHWIKT